MLKNEKNRGENRNEGYWNSQIDGWSEKYFVLSRTMVEHVHPIGFIHSHWWEMNVEKMNEMGRKQFLARCEAQKWLYIYCYNE